MRFGVGRQDGFGSMHRSRAGCRGRFLIGRRSVAERFCFHRGCSSEPPEQGRQADDEHPFDCAGGAEVGDDRPLEGAIFSRILSRFQDRLGSETVAERVPA